MKYFIKDRSDWIEFTNKIWGITDLNNIHYIEYMRTQDGNLNIFTFGPRENDVIVLWNQEIEDYLISEKDLLTNEFNNKLEEEIND